MFYKNWPYWLKGGVISVLIALMFTSIFLDEGIYGGGFMNFGFAASMLVLAFLPMSLFCAFFSLRCWDMGSYAQFILLGLSFNIIFYFIVGVIIGFVYGKIKKINKLKF